MANYRKRANRDARAGCAMCKPQKKFGYAIQGRQKFSQWRKIVGAEEAIKEYATI